MAALGKWLVGVILGWFVEYVKGLFLTAVGKVTRWWRQRQTAKKVEQDIADKKPRTEQVEKNELDDINS